MTNKILAIGFFFLLASVTLHAAESIDLAWEKKSNAQIEWQNNLADLLLQEIPETKEIIIIQRDLQITFIQMRKEKYYYLLQNDPTRIIRDQGQSKWYNFNWTKDDENNLLDISENYKYLKSIKESLLEKNQGHPMWTKLRAAFKDIRNTEKYQNLQKKLLNDLEEIYQNR